MGKNKKINNWLALGLLVVLMTLFFNSKQEKPFQSFFQTITKPFTSFFSETGAWLNRKIDFVSNISDLKNENEKLFNENLKLKFEISQLKEAENENRIFREELDLISKINFETEASLILGQTLSGNRQIIYLDKGSKNGIKEEMPVIVGEGFLVGKVIKVYQNSSEVELILDKNNKINAEIQETQIKGIVQGEYGTSAIMGLIPQVAEVKEGQTVITSGLGGIYPRGLLIGYIQKTEITVDQLFQKASLNLPIDFKNLRMVWIIKNAK